MRRQSYIARFNLLLAVLAIFSALGLPPGAAAQEQNAQPVVVDASAPSHPFPHFWEEMFGSGRATLSLRDSYRRDLREVKGVTDFRYVRFHAILNDDVGLYNEDAHGHAVYNFSYIDQIYDGLLANGVRPFVELSFMPEKLAAQPIHQAFWYHPNVSPPKSWVAWDDLIAALAKHLVARYGIDEVSKWYFEVWNEPNLDFWGGQPRQDTYWQLYDHTARTLKSVSPRLRVGGPATAQAAWVGAFIKHCHENHVPVDFVSTHVYGNDTAENVFGTHEQISRKDMVCRAVSKVHGEITTSVMPKIPLIWSEFNAAYDNEQDVTDAAYMGPWLGNMIRECDGLTKMMSYWTFSDVFEEQGVVKTPFYGGFGLIAELGIPKPSFNAFKLLHELGDRRIDSNSDSALVTRKSDGTVVVAVWNYAPPDKPGSAKTVTLEFKNFNPTQASISAVDPATGDSETAFQKMGSPAYPTKEQVRGLQAAAKLPAPSLEQISGHELKLTLPTHGLEVIELK
ncbi:MAG: GH39 family glycosyl hydrolase [Candidatus Acidiferrales bacterium]